MASLSAFSPAAAAAAVPCQQQHPQVFPKVSCKAFYVRCLPLQNSNVVCLSKEPCNPARALNTEIQEKVEASSSHCPAKNQQQALLLEWIALEEKQEKPYSRPTDPAAHVLANAIKEAVEVTDVDVILHGLHFDSRVYTSTIRTLGHLNKVRAAICLVQWLHSRSNPEDRPNAYIYCSLIGAMKAQRDFTNLSLVMDLIQKDGVEPTLIVYNNIIACYEQQDCHDEAMKYFLELVQKGLVPDHATFKALWSSPDTSSQFRKALTAFVTARDVLQEHGMDDAAEELRQTVSAFCSRNLCAELRAGKGPGYIIRLFEMADASMLEFSASHYDKILWACGSQPKDFVVAKFVMARMRKLSLPLDVHVCNHVLRFMGKEKKWWAALELYEEMTKEGPSPDANSLAIMRSHFNFLLKSSKERGTCRWSVQLLQKMEAHGIEPDKYAWNITLVACAAKVDPDLAMHVFKWMIEKGYQPDVLSYGALITTLEKGHLYAEAERVWEHMRRLGVEPNINVYTIMISVYGALQKPDKVKSLLDEMYESRVELTPITYNALLTECAKAADGESAVKWMKDMIKAGFEPDAVSYNQLVIALTKGGQVEFAKELYIRGENSHFVLSPGACESLVKACKLHGIKFDHPKPESKLDEPSSLVTEREDVFNGVIQSSAVSEADSKSEGDNSVISVGNVIPSQVVRDTEVEDMYAVSSQSGTP